MIYDCFRNIFFSSVGNVFKNFKLFEKKGAIKETKDKLKTIVLVFFTIGLEGIEPTFSNWKSDVLTIRR